MFVAICLVPLLVSLVHGWSVGVSVVDISPSLTELNTLRIYLGGYGALGFRGGVLGYARSVHDPVWARAFYMEDNARSGLVSVVIDSIGLGNVFIREIRNRANVATGIPIGNILVSATHTHCGPDLQGLWAGVTPSYREFVINGAVSAITRAFQSRQPADVTVSGRNPGTGYQNNRRGWGWAINTTTVVDAFFRGTTRRIGSLLNFAAHPVTLGANELTMGSDFGHYLRVRFENTTNAPVVWVNGPIGDVTPGCPGCPGGGFARAEAFGIRVADMALEMMSQIRVPLDDGLVVKTDTFDQVVTNVAFYTAWVAGILDGYYEGLPRDGQMVIPIVLANFKMGRNQASSIDGVTWPGESLVRNAAPVQNALTARFNLLFGLTQETIGYLVPTDEWQTGRNNNYEESVSADRLFGDEVRDRLLALIRRNSGGSSDKLQGAVSKPLSASAQSGEQKNLVELLTKLVQMMQSKFSNETHSIPHFMIEQFG